MAGALGIAGSRAGAAAFGPELGAFVGALTVGVASNLYAYLLHRPASVTLVPGILLLVPGAIGFRSLSSLLDREVVTGVETAFTMVLIGAGTRGRAPARERAGAATTLPLTQPRGWYCRWTDRRYSRSTWV